MPDPLLIRVLKGEKAERVPFWYMRQAGRYLPEYRELRSGAGDFLSLCFNPELAAEVTLQPLRRFNMDAAILFSDILVIPHALQRDLRFVQGEGPQLKPLEVEEISGLAECWQGHVLKPVMETVRRVRAALAPDKALIGFAGAPWTVACYMIEGHGSRDYLSARRFAREQPEKFLQLVELLAEVTAEYLIAQIENGADVVQIFDSWAGVLPEEEFTRWVVRPTQKMVEIINDRHPDVPIIGFARTASSQLVEYAAVTGINAMGLDYAVPLFWASEVFDGRIALQGNLDPVLLAGDKAGALRRAELILRTMEGKPFVFNLGHGMLPHTPIENIHALSEFLLNWND